MQSVWRKVQEPQHVSTVLLFVRRCRPICCFELAFDFMRQLFLICLSICMQAVNTHFNTTLIRVRRRSRWTFSIHFEIFRRRFDGVVIYLFDSDFKFFDDASKFPVMAKVPNGVKYCGEFPTNSVNYSTHGTLKNSAYFLISIAWVGRTNVRPTTDDRRQTDGRTTTLSNMNVSSRSLKIDWKFLRVIEKFEVRIEQINYDADRPSGTPLWGS